MRSLRYFAATGAAAALVLAGCSSGGGDTTQSTEAEQNDAATEAAEGGDVEVLLEIRIRTGLTGLTVAPPDKDVAFGGHCCHGDGFGRVVYRISHRVVALAVAGAQGTAAALFHPIVRLVFCFLRR